jgi:hypothetical protein
MARLRRSWPAWLAVLVSVVYVLIRLQAAAWDPVAIAEPSPIGANGRPDFSQGYDGQFTLAIAQQPGPDQVESKLDVPAYRYQRILLPIMARALALGTAALIPWGVLAINLAALFAGTLLLAEWLSGHGFWPGYGLIYGLWVGLVASAGLDLPEPLAFGLVIAGWMAAGRQRWPMAGLLFGLAIFAKETSLIFWAAWMLAIIMNRPWRLRPLAAILLPGLAFILWQIWLWRIFGSPGVGSGGAQASGFEWLPLMGLARIGFISAPVLGLFLVIFGPTILLPAFWAIWQGVRWLTQGAGDAESWALILSGIAVLFLPFSTFREPLGLARFASGLVLSIVLAAAAHGLRRPLRYGMAWIALLAILINR